MQVRQRRHYENPQLSDSNPGQRPPALARPRRGLSRPAHDRPRLDDRERCAAVDPARPALQPGRPHVGRQRIPDHLRKPAAPGRPCRRPDRTQEGLSRRRGGFYSPIGPERVFIPPPRPCWSPVPPIPPTGPPAPRRPPPPPPPHPPPPCRP